MLYISFCSTLGSRQPRPISCRDFHNSRRGHAQASPISDLRLDFEQKRTVFFFNHAESIYNFNHAYHVHASLPRAPQSYHQQQQLLASEANGQENRWHCPNANDYQPRSGVGKLIFRNWVTHHDHPCRKIRSNFPTITQRLECKCDVEYFPPEVLKLICAHLGYFVRY